MTKLWRKGEKRGVAETTKGKAATAAELLEWHSRLGDVCHPRFCLECKFGVSQKIEGWFRKLASRARVVKKIPVLVVSHSQIEGPLVVVRLRYLIEEGYKVGRKGTY